MATITNNNTDIKTESIDEDKLKNILKEISELKARLNNQEVNGKTIIKYVDQNAVKGNNNKVVSQIEIETGGINIKYSDKTSNFIYYNDITYLDQISTKSICFKKPTSVVLDLEEEDICLDKKVLEELLRKQ